MFSNSAGDGSLSEIYGNENEIAFFRVKGVGRLMRPICIFATDGKCCVGRKRSAISITFAETRFFRIARTFAASENQSVCYAAKGHVITEMQVDVCQVSYPEIST